MAYYLGIDGGGTKTVCAIGDENTLLATATAGPSNITRIGEAGARESLHQAIRKACAAAQIDPREIQHACIGAAGAGREEVVRAIQGLSAELIAGKIEVVGDMQIALHSAFGMHPGVIVIAGTGSIAYGRNAQGRTVRAGGWGFAISDEGSAHWIGRQAIAAILRATDQAGINQDPANQSVPESSPLFRAITSAWNLATSQQLANAANSAPDFATLLPPVLAAAEAGDEQAEQILAQAAAELARLASIILKHLFPVTTTTPSPVSLAMVGGVFRYSPRIREQFSTLLRAAYAPVIINSEVVEPVHGALQMAREAGA